MGDRAWTGITFSGKVNVENAEALVKELIDQGCDASDGLEGVLTVEHLREPHNQFSDDQCNYANMEGVEHLCQLVGISYLKVWHAGGEYGAGYELYNAVANRSFNVPGDDEPCLGLTELQDALKRGNTLQDVIAYLEAIANFSEHYPALEIVE